MLCQSTPAAPQRPSPPPYPLLVLLRLLQEAHPICLVLLSMDSRLQLLPYVLGLFLQLLLLLHCIAQPAAPLRGETLPSPSPANSRNFRPLCLKLQWRLSLLEAAPCAVLSGLGWLCVKAGTWRALQGINLHHLLHRCCILLY